MDEQQLQQHIENAHKVIEKIKTAMGEVVVGQEALRERLIVALISEGHILLEGVPGLAKTLSIKALSQAINADFKRIQFTPDLLPADLIGTEVFVPQTASFEVRKGPVFANFVLADEINRAPAKVQSALLETMQEHQVTIGKQTFRIPEPFFVMATQNPIEQEGTYALPEAQVDRFMMKIKVGYPSRDDERQMLSKVTEQDFGNHRVKAVASLNDIVTIKNLSREVYVDERVKQYIVDIVWASREPESFGLKLSPLIELGASPRASISLFLAARAEALCAGQHYVLPQNVKDVAFDVLRHRIIPTYEAEAQGLNSEVLIQNLLEGVPVP